MFLVYATRIFTLIPGVWVYMSFPGFPGMDEKIHPERHSAA